MTVTKAFLVDSLCNTHGFNANDARALVDNFYAEIAANLAAGTDVKLTGFGSFTLRDKKARPGLNPRTGERKVVSARRVVKFKAADKLKVFDSHII